MTGKSTDIPGFSLQETFPLHYLAKVGDFEELKRYLEAHPTSAVKQISRIDFSGRTILHYSAVGVNFAGCEKCVTFILKFLNDLEGERKETFVNIAVRRQTQRVRRQQWKGDDCQETIHFINAKDTKGETALHLAARNENTNIVTTLLLHSADVMAVSRDGTQALKLIYSKTPSAVTELLNRSVSFDYGIDSETFTKTERSYCLDFTAIIGNMTDRDDDEGDQQISDTIQSALYREAACLNSVNENETKVRKEILTHPLVRFFVEKKFTKLLTLIWTSIILKLLWISLYVWHAIDVYYDCCESALTDVQPLFSQPQAVYCSQFPFTLEIMTTSTNWTQTDADLARTSVMDCAKNSNSIIRLVPILLFTIYVIFTIGFKTVILYKAYLKIQNCFLWVFTLFLLVTLFPTEASFKVQFQFAAFTIAIGALVILEIVNKHIYWAIYLRVLIKVVERFIAILPLFLFIMLAFSVSLRMLFPTINPALKDFRDALMEVFASIANGKVEWSEGNNYQIGVDTQFETSGFIMFIVFYVLLILLLFRILIGFVKIQEEEELNEISQDLKSIFIFESIATSLPYRYMSNLSCLSFLQRFRERFMLCRNQKMQIWLGESDIPKHLRKPLRLLASKNPVKSRKHEVWESANNNENKPKKGRFTGNPKRVTTNENVVVIPPEDDVNNNNDAQPVRNQGQPVRNQGQPVLKIGNDDVDTNC
ncbi:Transient receptor potential channel pyrexia [Folsomia candida]|uniref:Transient receptor potential channel pyrexia n=1 Tax=Folsomia candida TaxID=158441 RepID=A0A226DCC1_FOLCA|nr:Transient receptor potential channel pyrexia [Folsomia candida]